jgi:VWFA-related protein
VHSPCSQCRRGDKSAESHFTTKTRRTRRIPWAVKLGHFRKWGQLLHHRFVITLLLLSVAGSLDFRASPAAHAQSETQEKPTLKKFGSSLKRTKWDSAKQAGVEAERSRNAGSEDIVRINTDLVVCDVMVRDKRGLAVTGLTADDFVVKEDDQPQHIDHFSLGSDVNVGRSIVLIIDYSNSLRAYIDRTINAAKMLVDKLGPRDRMAIVTDDVALLVDFTADKPTLKKALESLKVKAQTILGHSDQFSALLATVRELFDEEDIRPIIIFQTDGDQIIFLQPPDPLLSAGRRRSSITQFSLADVYAATEGSRATVYAVIPGFRLIGLAQAEQLERAKIDLERFIVSNGFGGDYLSRQPYHPSTKEVSDHLDFRLRGQLATAGVAKLTGGWTSFLEQPEQAAAIYESILSDINDRYVVGYYPTNKADDGKRRHL